MFFTDASWKATFSVSGMTPPAFDRWKIVGLPLGWPTFIVSTENEDEGSWDARALMVDDPHVLAQLLGETWPRVPTLQVIERGKLIPVDEIWTYEVARVREYAYRSGNRGLEMCGPYQSAGSHLANAHCIWNSRIGLLDKNGGDEF